MLWHARVVFSSHHLLHFLPCKVRVLQLVIMLTCIQPGGGGGEEGRNGVREEGGGMG